LPKAASKITDDLDVLPAFYDYPAEPHLVALGQAGAQSKGRKLLERPGQSRGEA
jgi:hypothetical protein